MSYSSCSYNRKQKKRVQHDDDDGTDTDSIVPFRDCDDLYAATSTVDCAYQNYCVVCAYKIANFDIALDDSFCKVIPNQRPEQCQRIVKAKQQEQQRHSDDALGYKRGMTVLTVGDGDFTFSLALARLGCHVTATSYETKETVLQCYHSVKINDTLMELESALGCTVLFSIDATRLRDTLPVSKQNYKYQRIVWNFPCLAVANGQDGQNKEMEHNKNLIRLFISNARQFLAAGNGGQIHINHKTKPPFNQWKIQEVAMSASSADNDIRYCGRIVLDRQLFPPYVPRKALDRKSFPCHDACTYIFDCRRQNAEAKPESSSSSSSLLGIPIVKSTTTMVDIHQPAAASCLIAVTPDLIRSLRSRLLKRRQHQLFANPKKRKRNQK